MIKVEIENTKKIYGLTKEQKDVIEKDLTLINPKYEQTVKYSRYATTRVPKYLKFFNNTSNYLEVPKGYRIPFKHAQIDNTVKVTVDYPDFLLSLRGSQEEAFNAYKNDPSRGIIVLQTGKGKSILGLFLAHFLKQKTLVIVHKDDLVSGWKADAKLCFGIDFDTGLIKAKSRKIGEQITIATIQTLNRLSDEELIKLKNEFGMIICDEMHHTPSSSFDILTEFPSKYLIGLTATPERADGLTSLFDFHFGGIAFRSEAVEEDEDILPVDVYIDKLYLRDYEVVKPKNGKILYHDLDTSIVLNNHYADNVVNSVIKEYHRGTSIIIFLNQKKHCRHYYELLTARGVPEAEIQLYYGDATESKDVMKERAESKEVRITIATYSIATEGTNVKQWEVAFLVSSLNNKKNVEQAIGRIRRTKEGKISPVRVYDYHLPEVPMVSRHVYTRVSRYKELHFNLKGTFVKRVIQFGRNR